MCELTRTSFSRNMIVAVAPDSSSMAVETGEVGDLASTVAKAR